MLKDFDEEKFRVESSSSGQSEASVRWKEFEIFWIHTKLKADKIIPSVPNRGGSGPARSDLQGARCIRATFTDGSKAITTDVFLKKNNPKSLNRSSKS